MCKASDDGSWPSDGHFGQLPIVMTEESIARNMMSIEPAVDVWRPSKERESERERESSSSIDDKEIHREPQ